jgi:hypothetical protein
MRGSHRLCATAIAGVAGLSLLVSRRIIIVHLFLDVNFQGSPKIKAQPRRAPQPTAHSRPADDHSDCQDHARSTW